MKGVAPFAGWAIDNSAAITGVSLAVDGVPVTAANYGDGRPDVCAVYPGHAGCPNVGWYVALDTRQFTNGSHTLAVTAQTANGKFATVATQFQVANPVPTTVTACIDSPTSTPVSGMLLAAGWAIDSSTTIASVTLSVDGVSQGQASINPRPDVCAVYKNPGGCPNVGWIERIDTTRLADGPHTLGVLVTNSNSKLLNLSRPFTVSNLRNSSVKTTLVYIDLPNPASGLLSGVTQFAGWAVDQVTPIAALALSIDGVPFSSFQPYITRPDVCAAYPGSAGCPFVGWAAPVDTSSLADGQHVLQVTATSQQGLRSTRAISFLTSNATQSASRGQVMVMDPPVPGATVSGTINMVGWAVDTTNPIQ